MSRYAHIKAFGTNTIINLDGVRMVLESADPNDTVTTRAVHILYHDHHTVVIDSEMLAKNDRAREELIAVLFKMITYGPADEKTPMGLPTGVTFKIAD